MNFKTEEMNFKTEITKTRTRTRTRARTRTMVDLTKKMMTGEMTRTRTRTPMPSACCWLAATSSLFTISLHHKINLF